MEGFRKLATTLALSTALVLALLLILIALGLALMPKWGAASIDRVLPPLMERTLGVEVELKVERIDWDLIDVAYLNLVLTDGTRILLEGFSGSYSGSSIGQGQLDTIQIASLTLDLGNTSAQAAQVGSEAAAKNTSEQLRDLVNIPPLADWLDLPFSRLDIEQLQIHHPLGHSQLNLNVSPALWRIGGRVTPLALDESFQLVAQLDRQRLNSTGDSTATNQEQGQLLVQLAQGTAVRTRLLAEIRQSATHTQLDIQQQTALGSWLAELIPALNPELASAIQEHMPYSLLTDQLNVSGSLELPNQARLPNDLTVAANVKLSTRPVQIDLSDANALSGLTWQKGALNVRVTHQPGADWHVHLDLDELGWAFNDESARIAAVSQPAQLALQCNQKADQCSIKTTATKPIILDVWPNTSATGKAPLQWIAKTDLAWQQTEANSQLSGTINLNAHLGLSWFEELMNASLEDMTWQPEAIRPSEHIQAEVTGRFSISTEEADSQLTLSSFLFKAQLPAAQLHPLASGHSETEPPEVNADLTHWQLSPINLSSVLPQPLSLPLDTPNPWLLTKNRLSIQLDPMSIKLMSNPVSNASTQQNSEAIAEFRLKPSTAECSLNWLTPECDWQLAYSDARWEQWTMPAGRLNGQFSINDASLSGLWQLLTASDQLDISGHFDHNSNTETGQMQWRLKSTPLNWDQLGLTDMEVLTGVQLLGGQLTGQGWVDWDLSTDQIWPDLMLRGENISAIYDNQLTLEGWRFLIAAHRYHPSPSTSPLLSKRGALPEPESTPLSFSVPMSVDLQIAGDSLNTGVELTHILANLRLRLSEQGDRAQVDLNKLHANLLGGRVALSSGTFDTQNPENRLIVDVQNLQLADIAALEPGSDILATGTLDGQLPIDLGPDGASVEGGMLHARDPGGSLIFKSDTSQALGASDPTVGMAMQVLENFQYQQLTSQLAYQPTGEARLNLSFEGHNPDFFDGQSTRLNVALDYNLHDLLESIRLTEDLIEQVEAKYQ